MSTLHNIIAERDAEIAQLRFLLETSLAKNADLQSKLTIAVEALESVSNFEAGYRVEGSLFNPKTYKYEMQMLEEVWVNPAREALAKIKGDTE